MAVLEEEEAGPEQAVAPGSASTATSAVAGGGRPKSHPNWHGGLNRVKGSPGNLNHGGGGSGGADRFGLASADSEAAKDHVTSASYSLHSAEEEEEAAVVSVHEPNSTPTAGTTPTRPWWRPWLAKRAPPQGRPGIAPWESAGASRAAAEGTPTEEGESGGSRSLKNLHAASSLDGDKKAYSTQGGREDEEDDGEDEDAIARRVDVDKSKKEGQPQKKKTTPAAVAIGADPLREQPVVLAQAPEVQAWVVSTDCSSELT